MTVRTILCMVALVLFCSPTPTVEAQQPKRSGLGRKDKLRILVDKVMLPEESWIAKEWIVRETAEAGFNVFSPRLGHDRLDEVREVTKWCEKYGIFHIPWMRGTLSAPGGAQADGKRILWASGTEQPLYSACSDEFWEWTTRYIVEYAKLSAQSDHIFGVFLDYENYARGGSGNLYQITYEDVIFEPFLKSQKIELPELPPDGRKSWLEEQQLHEEFAQFQIDHWRQRCRKLRAEVDKHDPAFQFCIYPSPGTPFMVQACYQEWSTKGGPIILGDPWVYGRPSRYLPQAEALEANKQKLVNGMTIPQEAGIPFIYSGGIDPVVTGADPEFCGKNALMISDVTDGYWVFYEGPKYKEDHRDYFRWFKWANDRITSGDLNAWHEPRETPDEWVLDVFNKSHGGLVPVSATTADEKTTLAKIRFRKENLFLLAGKRGEPVRVTFQNLPVAKYVNLLAWDLRDPDGKKITSGTIPHDQQGTVAFTPEKDAVYFLGASSGGCAYSLLDSNVAAAVCTGYGASFIHAGGPTYFHVPKDTHEFTIKATGWGAETVRVNVFDPEGEQVTTGQTTLQETTVEIRVKVADGAGKTWSLSTAKADKGVVEDYSLEFSENMPPVLSLTPQQVFTFGGKE